MADRPLDAVEREQLCDLFVSLGPDAPTLCEGWSTLDLAAHLYVREHNLLSGFAILGGDRFAGLEKRLMDRAKGRGYPALVARLRKGAPLPWRAPGVRTLLNLNEYFVHHEDVRRANGLEPRTGVDALEAALWRLLGRSSRFVVRGLKGSGLEVVAPGYGSETIRKATPTATITGSPQELALYLNGRREVARVEVTGDDAALDSLEQARLGI